MLFRSRGEREGREGEGEFNNMYLHWCPRQHSSLPDEESGILKSSCMDGMRDWVERTEWLTPAGRLAEGSKEEADFLLRGSCLFPFLRLNRRPLKGGREKLRGGRKRGWKGGREGRKGRRKERRPVVAMETHARDFLGVVPWAGALNESPNNRLSQIGRAHV